MSDKPTEDPNSGTDGDTPLNRPNPKSPREAIQPEPAPQPPARSRHVRNPVVIVINFLLSLAVLGVIAAGGLLYWGKAEFEDTAAVKALIDKYDGVDMGMGTQLEIKALK